MRAAPGTELSARVRGVLVAVTTVVLAVAAHGLAGGGLPTGATTVLLAGLAAVLGSVTATVPWLGRGAASPLPILATGQLLAHLTLAVGAGHHAVADPIVAGSPMLAAHAGAVAVCSVLLVAADRVGPAVASAVRAVVAVVLGRLAATGPVLGAPAAVPLRSFAAQLCRTCAPRRGPPLPA